MARRRLVQSTRYSEVMAARALVFEDADGDGGPGPIMGTGSGGGSGGPGISADDGRYVERDPLHAASSLLNLASTCLYMTNYYIVAPTSGAYCERLGSSEALSGLIIGMTPNAALLATVLYGWWSNHSYRSALLFAAACSMAGNVLYALALHYDSIAMVMVGRFLNGFGSARAVNRRFIADTFAKSERTAASADFVTAGALGMALGPAVAAALSRVRAAGDLWTAETSVAWVMFGLWAAFFGLAALFFQEPDRAALLLVPPTPAPGGGGEGRPLIAFRSTTSSGKDGYMPLPSSPRKAPKPSLLRNIPVLVTLLLYFVLKLALEALLSSCSSVTSFYFAWDSRQSGMFMAILGLLMFPANMVVARCSHRYDDREMILFSLVAMLLGVIGILNFSGVHYSSGQYVVSGIVIFLSANALEGPNMGLLSKTIPREWATGIFNSGFLATEAGTAARSVGDALISLVAAYLGFGNLLNGTFMPLALLVLASIFVTRRYYSKMVDPDEDDKIDGKST